MLKTSLLMSAAALAYAGVAFAPADGPRGGAKAPPPPPPPPASPNLVQGDAAADTGKPVFASDAVSDGVAPSAPGNLPAFTFDDVPLPEKTIGRSSDSNVTSVVRQKLSAIPVGKSWLEPVGEVSDSITDPKEREKALKELAKKVQNRIQGDIRRHKAVEANKRHNFSVLFVNDEQRGTGVRVYRNEDADPKPRKAKAAQPAAAEQPAATTA